MLKRIFTGLLCAGALLVSTGLFATVHAQDAAYPNKPIRFVVPYPPGGPLDTVARTLADQVKPPLGILWRSLLLPNLTVRSQ